jgi:prepilin-type N-terminal cleavage/methylation domain-containing protein
VNGGHVFGRFLPDRPFCRPLVFFQAGGWIVTSVQSCGEAAISMPCRLVAGSPCRLGSLSSRRHGFTLVELLVVIAIIGTLVGLLLPAVQSARESGRRSACQNNLRQVGFALANYESAKLVMPPMCDYAGTSGGGHVSSFVLLLPFLEEQDLYNKAASGTGNSGTPVLPFAPRTTDSYPVWNRWLRQFVCPSDPSASLQGSAYAGARGPSSYAANKGDWWLSPTAGGPASYTGSHEGYTGDKKSFRGMFGVNVGLKSADITDGLSFTMAYGERRIYRGETSRVPDAMWGNGNSWSDPNACRTPSVLASNIVDGQFVGSGAIIVSWPNSTNWSAWASGLVFYHGIVTAVPPNGPSCDMNGSPWWNLGLYTASSFHQGGVFAVMGDGAVRFVTDTVDAGNQSANAGNNSAGTNAPIINAQSPFGVWGAMGSRCGGETVKYQE